MNYLTKAKERWEKVSGEKMTKEEETMFNWGYAYGVKDLCELREKK